MLDERLVRASAGLEAHRPGVARREHGDADELILRGAGARRLNASPALAGRCGRSGRSGPDKQARQHERNGERPEDIPGRRLCARHYHSPTMPALRAERQ